MPNREQPTKRRDAFWALQRRWGMPDLDPAQRKTLLMLGAAEFFDHYDMGLLGLALLQIQRSLAIPDAEVGSVMAAVRMGVIPALALAVLADRFGRRRLLLLTILGFTLTTFATAFAQTTAQFVALQFLSRMFVYAESMLAVVVLAEELRADQRGWGIGALGALGALGHGLSAIVFGAIDVLPFGWRALYAVGVVPMLFLAWFRRHMKETQRFEASRASREDRGDWRDWVEPLRRLLRHYPGRLGTLCLALWPLDFVLLTATTFMAKALQEMHGYSPGQVTLLYIAGGAVGIFGNTLSGSLSDRLGRRPVMVSLLAVAGACLYGFYNLSGWVIAPLWITQVFAMMGVGVLFRTLGSELFPTSYRSTASAVRAIVATLGAVVGLTLEGWLFERLGSHAAAITCMLPALLIPALVAWFLLPETALRELEEIAPED